MNTKPKALLFSHICYETHITGAEKMLLFLAKELQPHMSCTIVVPNEGVLSAEAQRFGIRTIVHQHPNVYELYTPDPYIEETLGRLQSGHEFGSLVNMLHMIQPDLVVTNTCVNALPAVAARLVGVPVAWIVAEAMIQNEYTPAAVAMIDRCADWLIGISHATLQPFQAVAGHKKMVLPPSWNEEEFGSLWGVARHRRRSELGIPGNVPVVGYISSDIYANKGLDHFVQMGLSLCESYPEAQFMIVGKPVDESYFEACMQLIQERGYASRFIILPFEHDIKSLYPAMDIVVVPSLLNEGFGMTALEGLLFGKAVVAYRSGGLVEVLTSTGGGYFLADKGDISGLEAKVGLLLADPTLRGSVGARNKETVRQVYGIEAYRFRLRGILMRIMQVLEEDAVSERRTVRKWPNGSLVRGAGSTLVFFLQDGTKRPYEHEADFLFYRHRWDQVATVPDADLRAYPIAHPVKNASPYRLHAPGTLAAKGPGRTVYWLHDGVRHPVPSQRALRALGFTPDRVVPMPDAELALYPLGDPVPEPSRRRALRARRAKRARRGVRLQRLQRLRRRAKPGGLRLKRRLPRARRGSASRARRRRAAAAGRRNLRRRKFRKEARAARTRR
jgi:glycosyltransferase involved in cell wall biosynthesis